MASTKASVPVAKTELIAGLDVGTSKISLVIARIQNKAIEIIGLSEVASTGLRKGTVVNVDATVDAIKKAKDEAELMAGVKVDKVWVAFGGTHIGSLNTKGMVAIKNKEVSKDDVKRVLEAASAVALPEDREILHILPQSYCVDSQDGIKDPLGISGVRLEASVHVITGSRMALVNTKKCVQKAGLQILGIVSEGLAAGMSTLTEDEKELGVVVVDLGAGTSNITIFVKGSIVQTVILPVGGSHLTHDIAVGLRTPTSEAETIKKKFGCAMTSLVESDQTIDVPSVGGRNPRTVSRKTLAEIIEPRAEEILNLINNEIIKNGNQKLIGSGVVMTGGASGLEGLLELGEFIFEMPVRRGIPVGVSGLKEVIENAGFSTAVGLIQYGMERRQSSVVGTNFVEMFKTKVSHFLDGAF